MSVYYTEDGLRKWDEQLWPYTNNSRGNPTTEPPLSKVIKVYIACNVKTNVVGRSIKIVDNEDNSIILQHFDNTSVGTWTAYGYKVIINEESESPHVLEFNSSEEADKAVLRISKIIDGLDVQACD